MEGIKLIKEQDSSIKIIILTTLVNLDYIEEALKYGIDGFISKDIRDEDLIRVIINNVNGLKVVQESILEKIINKLENYKESIFSKGYNLDIRLTEREKSVLELIVAGKDNKEIAENLYLTHGSVKNIVSVLLQKFNVRDRTQLVIHVIKNNPA